MKSVLFLPLALLAGALHGAPALKSGVFEPPRAAPEIALPSSHGDFRLSRYRGNCCLLACISVL